MKPIIMSTEDVRSMLDGRKTMMRMVIKPQPTHWDDGERLYDKDNIVGPEFYNPTRVGKDGEQYPGEEVYGIYSDNGEYGCKAPFQPGDVLFVRETWARLSEKEYLYQADDAGINSRKIWRSKGVGAIYEPWMSPVTMPREAARLFLRVKDVRVERVQDISNEGVEREGLPINYEIYNNSDHQLRRGYKRELRKRFSRVWDARNAKRGYGWDSNPYVWVIEFERTPSGAIGPEQDGTAPNGDKGAEL